MDWDHLRYVLAVARAGTLSAAARRLQVNQTTVARRISAAQRELNARLFDRHDGVLRPTKAGAAAIARAERVEQEMLAIRDTVAGSDAIAQGVVRITSVPLLVNRLLIPALPKLASAYPRLRLELIAEPRNLSLTRREADIALRLARPQSGTALARRVGRLDYAVFAPRRRTAAGLPWIPYEEGLSDLPQARWIANAAADGSIASAQVNDAEAILQGVRAGLGKSLLPCFLAGRVAGIRQVGGPTLSREIWLLVHPELRHQARIAVVLAWLEQAIRSATRR
jgi:DNA-binding transcriptional LysR family regulator